MFRTEKAIYNDDLDFSISLPLPWNRLNGKTILITGATGMLGTYLIDVLMKLQEKKKIFFNIIGIARNQNRFEERFAPYLGRNNFTCLSHDVNIPFDEISKVDYIFHLASNTHPISYAREPINTILTNVVGLNNLLELAAKSESKRFIYASSVEIYGENRGDVEKFSEDYCGYIDCNTMRAGYPEGKRTGEALCQAYIKQKNLDVVIPRLSRVYGSTVLPTDSKASSQFIKNAIDKHDIILKSEGKQFFSYSYIADAINATLYCLFFGENGNAYNICDPKSDITLKDLAQIIADIAEVSVKFDIPEETEREGFSKTTIGAMDCKKISKLGWNAHYSIKEGLERTISLLKN